jgi:hypothetical protein
VPAQGWHDRTSCVTGRRIDGRGSRAAAAPRRRGRSARLPRGFPSPQQTELSRRLRPAWNRVGQSVRRTGARMRRLVFGLLENTSCLPRQRGQKFWHGASCRRLIAGCAVSAGDMLERDCLLAEALKARSGRSEPFPRSRRRLCRTARGAHSPWLVVADLKVDGGLVNARRGRAPGATASVCSNGDQ